MFQTRARALYQYANRNAHPLSGFAAKFMCGLSVDVSAQIRTHARIIVYLLVVLLRRCCTATCRPCRPRATSSGLAC